MKTLKLEVTAENGTTYGADITIPDGPLTTEQIGAVVKENVSPAFMCLMDRAGIRMPWRDELRAEFGVEFVDRFPAVNGREQ